MTFIWLQMKSQNFKMQKLSFHFLGNKLECGRKEKRRFRTVRCFARNGEIS